MFMTHARFKLALTAFAITVVTPSHGQTISWPDTFTGQPDFEFTRTDIVKEIQEKRPESFSILTGNLDRSLSTHKGLTPSPLKHLKTLLRYIVDITRTNLLLLSVRKIRFRKHT